ncbi:MAG: malto-oligosyltrehalose trehalohydrolase [Chloroflexaceae bacterium]
MTWELPIGAQPDAQGTRFRVWAPRARQVQVLIEQQEGRQRFDLIAEGNGYFAGHVAGTGSGTRYWYSVDGGPPRPDPASRSQPDGPHGSSEVVDPYAFVWHDAAWHGLPIAEMVIYELHVGTVTAEGTFEGLISRLDELVRLGINTIELMPVASFPGRRGWGYDGVNLFAPHAAYGGPDGLRRLVDAAHVRSLAVILDVVYNHFGPDGNYLRDFSRDYFTGRHHTPWGEAVNMDGPNNRPVREYVVANALHWFYEYHLDGLRLDAVHALIDDSPTHIVAELAARVHAALPAGRRVVLIAENDGNDPRLVRSSTAGGWGLDAVWADDFHHQVHVALTGERDGYYVNYSGSAADLATTVRQGWFYTGQVMRSTGQPRGAPADDVAPAHFVYCLQNHDQVGNRAFGERLHHQVSLAAYRAASALLLLAPQTPLLWMGQEWAASTPFLFFTDHHDELGRQITAGRRKEFAAFSAFRGAEVPDPQAEATFRRSILNWEERQRPPHAGMLRLYRDLLRLRRDHAALRPAGTFSVQPLGERVIALRREAERSDARALLVIVNLGGPAQVSLTGAPELAAPADRPWQRLLDTEAPEYGGETPVRLASNMVHFDGPAAVALG